MEGMANMRKKIGLVTYYGDNYGACLQAYALQSSINNLGYICSIVEYKAIFSKCKNKNIISKFIKILKDNDVKHIISRYKTSKYITEANQSRHALCEKFRDSNLQIAHNKCLSDEDFYLIPLDFDAYVCGSDQIWNPTFYGKCHPIYYLDFVPIGKKRIAYAPSVGISDIDVKYEDDLKKYLNKFDNISVREINSVDLLSKYTTKKIEWVLDPTLLLKVEDYMKLECDIIAPQKPYIFCYLFGIDENTNNIKRKIKSITNMDIVSIPFVKREILSDDIKIMDAGPTEFIHLIKNASLVLTDSFHATVFSINFKIPFVSLLRQKENEKNEMSSRIKSILKKLNLENRLIKDIDSIPSDLMNINFSETERKLEKYRKESIRYLKEALNTI